VREIRLTVSVNAAMPNDFGYSALMAPAAYMRRLSSACETETGAMPRGQSRSSHRTDSVVRAGDKSQAVRPGMLPLPQGADAPATGAQGHLAQLRECRVGLRAHRSRANQLDYA
jgi:hypothetical protein